ncbi:hypothetical protein KEM48_003546 [Puccinia striiformis f. sp. tritici PST-130]|nr:hypothetical protein KEM48_003546 [Puccinia striiformis f. sp. tritici PST-130]
MIFGNLIRISIVLLFINLQDRTCLKLSQYAPRSKNSIQSRQTIPTGLPSKGGKGKGAGSGLDDSSGCKTYMMMGARGTTEPQGSSMAYTKMAKNVLQAVPGGGLMDIEYPSSVEYTRTPQEGAATGLKYIQAQVAKCPQMVFVLMGYSKGVSQISQPNETIRAWRQAMVQSQILAHKDLPPKKVWLQCSSETLTSKAAPRRTNVKLKPGKVSWRNDDEDSGRLYRYDFRLLSQR